MFLGWVENIAEKGENTNNQHSLLFLHCFQKASCLRSLKVVIVWYRVYESSSDRILSMSEMKIFADDKYNVTLNIKSVFHGVENLVGKGGNAGYQHFILFPQCFQKFLFPHRRQKSSLCGKGLMHLKNVSWRLIWVETFCFIIQIDLTLCHTIQTFNDPEIQTFWWPAFSTHPKKNFCFEFTFIL